MVRYVLFMSYIGTRYRGAAKQVGCTRLLDIDSIEGAIEVALNTAITPRSRIKPAVAISSRTDAGVHALINTAQVELIHPKDPLYDTEYIIKKLNMWFGRCGHEIRITSIHPVTEEFDARRSALSRKYIYRLAIAKHPDNHKLPIAELGRCWHVKGDVDLDALRHATRLFMGRKDFGTFAAKNRTNREIRYVRELYSLTIEPTTSLMPDDSLSAGFNFWAITVHSRAFLYNQVRRIVGALIGLATGTINERDINIMLHVPSYFNWDPRLTIAPPQGLFLKAIEYDMDQLAACTITAPPITEPCKLAVSQ